MELHGDDDDHRHRRCRRSQVMDHLEHVRLELAEAILEQTCEKYFTFFFFLLKTSLFSFAKEGEKTMSIHKT